jgi:ligand-binding sensor domain-containing protein
MHSCLANIKRSCRLLWTGCCLIVSEGYSQPASFYFNHLSAAQGLIDVTVNALDQDEDGFTWIASLGGINRFDGQRVKRFTHIPGNSRSLINDVPYALYAGKNHTLWIGYTHGLWSLHTQTGLAKEHPALRGRNIYYINGIDSNRLLILHNKGAETYHIPSGRLLPMTQTGDSTGKQWLQQRLFGVCISGREIFLGAQNSILIYTPKTRTVRKIPLSLPNGVADRIEAGEDGILWVALFGQKKLMKLNRAGMVLKTFPLSLTPTDNPVFFGANDMLRLGHTLWFSTIGEGLIGFDMDKEEFSQYKHQVQQPGSLSSDYIRTMFRGRDGSLWINTIVELDYIKPNTNIFRLLLPFQKADEPEYGRGITEDVSGNFWFTTPDGVSFWNPKSGERKIWRNEEGKPRRIYFNSSRAVVEDNENRIWFATGTGVNRYHPNRGNMEFLNARNGVPEAFYFSAQKLKDGTVWLGTRDYDGFYFYHPSDQKIHSIAQHPRLKAFAGKGGRYAMQDSKGRLWLGFNGDGVVMYDAQKDSVRTWLQRDTALRPELAGNLIVDIKEDKKGVIWVSAFGGVTGIDIEHDRTYIFNDRNGLKTNIVGPLGVDAHNRLWIGTAAGLAMLDSGRTNLIPVGSEWGIDQITFPEHPGYYALNGDIILPCEGGYLRFDPLLYRPVFKALPCFATSLEVFNQSGTDVQEIMHEKNLHLGSAQNFFSIELLAINYENPRQTWYAYKLGGFDKEWHYTQSPKAMYTNVPGGRYTFLYKATNHKGFWDVPSKSIAIDIDTIFYKTPWFWAILIALAGALLYAYYRFRINNQRQFFELETKTYELEKEKASMMYENLVQQLNPHFLFNSLTSLSGLIATNQKLASTFLDQMSKIYRYILKNRDNELVSLKEETSFVQLYINLQKTRFKDGLMVYFNIPEDELYKKIVPVTLQNLMENAIKHNIIDLESPLIIHFETEDGLLVVRNNIQRKKMVETSNKQGLESLRSLYRFMTDRAVQIEDDGVNFVVRVPLL